MRRFADKQRGRAIAQAKTRRALDGKISIGADFIGSSFQMTAQRFDYGARSGGGAHRRIADAQDGSRRRPVIEHGVKLDHAEHVRERHVERARDFTGDFFGDPAVGSLRGVQRREESGPALRC